MATQQGNLAHDSTDSVDTLTEFLRRVIEAACAEAMQNKSANSYLMNEEWLRLGDRNFHGWEMTTLLRRNYPKLASLLCGAQNLMPLTNEIIDLCRGDGLLDSNVMRYADGQNVRDHRWLEQMQVERIITGPLVARYFERVGGFGYDPGVAQDIASSAVTALMATAAPASRLSPLVNMRLIASEYQVDPGVRIRTLASEDIEVWLNREYSAWSVGDRPAPINQLNRL